MNTRRIIFSQSVNGHYLEYLHHLYMACLKEPVETIFVVPTAFSKQKFLFEWPEAEHIRFDLQPIDIWSVGLLRRSFRLTRILRSAIRQHKAASAFLIDIDLFMPLLPLLYFGRAKISGILYGIYLYRWHELKTFRKLYYVINHWLYAKAPIFNKIFVLNDRAAAAIYNRTFRTTRFVYLPDPFAAIQFEAIDFRAQYGIQPGQKIFFHFGSMGKRKGTLLILESILKLKPEEKKDYVFVFAGIIQDSIKKNFEKLIAEIGDGCRLLIFDRFCEFSFFANWCRTCDAILIPYLTSYGSSGVIGYAAQFRKPAITTSAGLIGKLVRRNHLGLTLTKLTPENLVVAYGSVDNWKHSDERYLTNNSVEQFITLFNHNFGLVDHNS